MFSFGKWVALGVSIIARAAVIDDGFDCRLRDLAFDYARDVVLSTWSPVRADSAAALVGEGLNILECADSKQSRARFDTSPTLGRRKLLVDEEFLFVSIDGDDAAPGTVESPLRSITGAQQRIRKRWPEASNRPPISVFLRGGTYYTNSAAHFRADDSGSSPGNSIVYAAALDISGEPETVTLAGGVDLNAKYDLSWAPASSPRGALVATLPPDAPRPDAQDQLFLGGVPLVRARVPNGHPWVPLDGFNLTVGRNFSATHVELPDQPISFGSCGKSPWPDPPKVARGECGELLDSVNLVAGLVASHLAAHFDNALACKEACASDSRCNFWTWHDSEQGSYALACYVRYDTTFHYEAPYAGHTSGVCNSTLPGNGVTSDFPCDMATAVCKSTNATQWPLGHANSVSYIGKASAEDLGGTLIPVDTCIEHTRTDKDFPLEWGAKTFGLIDKDNETHVWMNKMDHTHNLPLWYGPWAGGMAVDATQDTGGLYLGSLNWTKPSDIVVHAMADGEWGGCQFKVADADVEKNINDQAILRFQYGGWQQARGAMLYGDRSEQAEHGNRYYMEGSLEFLDKEGEWHFDSETNSIYVFPPAEVKVDADSMLGQELLLTQVDRLFEFVGEGENRVRNIAIANLTLAYTSAQFFKPHEETSGGDYAIHRGAAVFAESAGNITVIGNTFKHIGGNAIFLSNAVGDVRVSSNLFRFIGTSGVSLVGRTGSAMGDGRDGEAIVQRHGKDRDNGVRLPRRNTIDHNIFIDWGIWDKQSACYHKAITASDNTFLNNICFNSSRHAVNYQDSMSGGGLVEGNVFFNLNRESKDTAAFNSWGRRTYVLSDYDNDPAIPRLVPKDFHSIRRNFVLTRNYHAVGYQDNGDGIRCDDGATWYNLSSNVLYKAYVEFNGGGQLWTHGNLFIRSGWKLCHHLTKGGSSFDTFVDPERVWQPICGPEPCADFWAPVDPATGQPPAEYRGDHNIVANSAAGRVDWSGLWCGLNLSSWRSRTQQDEGTKEIQDAAEWYPDAVVDRARKQLQAHMTHAPPTLLRMSHGTMGGRIVFI